AVSTSLRRVPTDIARFCLYTRRDRRRIRPQVFFINNVMPGDYESLDPRRPVLHRISDQIQATLLMVAAGSLGIHEPKVVSVERRKAIAVGIGCISSYQRLSKLCDRVVASRF